MHIVGREKLKDFWQRRPDSEGRLKAWLAEAKHADWSTPADIKARCGSASILKNNRVVFNIGGNKYRLVVQIDYQRRIILILFVGTHKEYDRIDAETI